MLKFLVNRWVHFFLLIVLLGVGITYSFSETRWRKEMQYLVFDYFNQTYPRESSDEIIIIDIDDDSLERIGQWPWPRTVVAEMLTALTSMGAKVVAFDGVFSEPDRSSPDLIAERLPEDKTLNELKQNLMTLPNHDDVLAQAIKDSGIFVSGFTYGSYSRKTHKPELKKQILLKTEDKKHFLQRASSFETAASFLPNLQKASAGNGSFMASPDHDGVLRRTGMIFSDGKVLYPSLSLEALRIGENFTKVNYKVGKTPLAEKKWVDTNYRLVLKDHKLSSKKEYIVPLEDDAKMLVYYRHFKKQDYLSAYKTLNPSFYEEAKEQVKDRYVLVGASAEGLKDLRSTAIQPFRPGVEIHANVLEQMLQGVYLSRPNNASVAEAFFILLTGLLMIFLAPFVHVFFIAFLCGSLVLTAFFGSAWAYTHHHLLLDPFYPSLVVFGIFMISALFTYLRVESEKYQVRNAFGHYISPAFMKDLTKNPDKLKLGGEIRELSILFSDIRSFTTISEGLRPEELIQLMNDFLTPMSDLVMQHRGTIDKYMGDAMMAFWNAPLDDPDHARNACIAALGMQDALEPINEEIKRKAKEAGKDPVLLKAGIGINTGDCAVGNMGSRQRFAYSTLGDAVNLASRLEGQTKNYGVRTLIGESTRDAVPDFATLEVDLIQVKGKTKPVHVFTLLGDDKMASTEDFQTWKKKHNAMIDAYRRAQFKEASALCHELKKQSAADLVVCYELYIDRCAEMIKMPPEENWDGVFVATSK